ncbi:MAG TPA: AI-2E family transporter, partial [Bacillota bacterium]|nr:AI-2E family transporter [Bacillota bacterium]
QGEALVQQKKFGTYFSGKVQQQAGAVLQQTVPLITRNLQAVLAVFSGVTALLVTVPFILFYFLRDDQEFLAVLSERIPRRYRREIELTMEAVDRILAAYITGQMILAAGQSILMYLGFWLIGLKYPLILALIIFITSFIPMFGILLGIIPAILLGLPGGLWMVIKVLGLMVLINILRKLIAPQLVGKRLKIHPLTIILLFIVTGALFGFFGILLAVPTYAVLKEVIKGARQLIQLRRADCEP